MEVSRVKIDGAQCNSQVMVKCSLLNSDEEEAEVLELPSGCVRFLAASRAIGLLHSPFAGSSYVPFCVGKTDSISGRALDVAM